MTKKADWTELHEALAYAYVLGWYDGTKGKKTDKGKIGVAQYLVHHHPNLLMALKAKELFQEVVKELEEIQCPEMHALQIVDCMPDPFYELRDLLRNETKAATRKATGENIEE